jgi:hypothetical protein
VRIDFVVTGEYPGDSMNAFVRQKYTELWDAARESDQP